MNIQWALKNIMARKGGEKSKQMAGNRAKSLAQINLVRKEEALARGKQVMNITKTRKRKT